MSYHCDICDKVRYGKELKVPYKVRNVTYEKCFVKHNRETNKTKMFVKSTSIGREHAEEHKLCEECYEANKDSEPIAETSKTVKFIETRQRQKRVFNRKETNRKETNRRNDHNDKEDYKDDQVEDYKY